ncbi:MAG: ABC transporter permease [Gemmatimonadales bacterium]|nr:MAG: ABC transporter permease [Gemmatimonadales bacterium]
MEKPHKIILPPGPLLRVNWQELWAYRELLFFLAWRDILIRYKQAVFGVLWALIQPLIKVVVFSLIFGRFAKIDSEGFPYPVFVFAGLLPWQFFSESLGHSSGSVLGSSGLITKVYFPRLIIPLSSIGAALLDFAISFVLLVGMMFYYGVAPTAGLLMMGPLILMTVLVSLGVGILLSALTVSYRDFRYVIPFMMQIWMFLTPVVYPARFIPETWRWLLFLNPMSGVVDGYRSAILGKSFDWPNLGLSLVMGVAIFLLGVLYFRKTESHFADIV